MIKTDPESGIKLEKVNNISDNQGTKKAPTEEERSDDELTNS